MIGRLRGQVAERTGSHMIVDVGGVGYLVHVLPSVSARVGETIELLIYTAVRDDAINLFGFIQREEKVLFDLLIGVPGVGPVKAMNILQTPVPVFVEMITARSVAQLAKLPGVGKKTAERLLVDLADKVGAIGLGADRPVVVMRPAPAVLPSSIAGDLVSALVNLGFKETAAVESAQAAIAALGEDASLDRLLRDALARNRPR
ncbi:MAG: Holliday junction branch migration protein RuvA [Myxococcales bacterium]|nr:Holliday junction branch migration protein RuvA [Myxococcales bacterium]